MKYLDWGRGGGSPDEVHLSWSVCLKGGGVCAMFERSLHFTSESLHHARVHGVRAQGEEETFTGVSGVLGKAESGKRKSAASHMGGGPLV